LKPQADATRTPDLQPVRRAVPADAPGIAECIVGGWKTGYRGILPDDFLDGLTLQPRIVAWTNVLETGGDGNTPGWIVDVDGRVAGFIGSGPARDPDVPAPAAEVYALYIRPGYWRLGIGRMLMDQFVQHWRAQGATTQVLWVFEKNDRARRFYEAMGWQLDGARQELRLADSSAIEIRYRRRLHPTEERA
jgi:GNAT superfamily N-acetyltransferase